MSAHHRFESPAVRWAGRGSLVTLALLLPAVAARAQSDWIDLFPSATTVAHAAFEELKVTAQRGNVGLTTDADSIAINLAGTERAKYQAADFSCRSPWSSDAYYAGTVHTHISWITDGDKFSSTDIETTRNLRKPGVMPGFERNYLVGMDGRVYSFDGSGSPQSAVTCPPTRSGP